MNNYIKIINTLFIVNTFISPLYAGGVCSSAKGADVKVAPAKAAVKRASRSFAAVATMPQGAAAGAPAQEPAAERVLILELPVCKLLENDTYLFRMERTYEQAGKTYVKKTYWRDAFRVEDGAGKSMFFDKYDTSVLGVFPTHTVKMIYPETEVEKKRKRALAHSPTGHALRAPAAVQPADFAGPIVTVYGDGNVVIHGAVSVDRGDVVPVPASSKEEGKRFPRLHTSFPESPKASVYRKLSPRYYAALHESEATPVTDEQDPSLATLRVQRETFEQHKPELSPTARALALETINTKRNGENRYLFAERSMPT